ncbi:hypothetical protein LOZ51_004375 [Ophidiomyces ophidiicola]|nr:hypothetical protein LOZ55_004717 [Ophidiomyces ophidiicola]KAI1979214.1 hypothetical protein LOZ54_006122 [Ophidiomyces ophidiicola]KAI1991786.1 hypothetical protein LOZ51_004375 [Ophidiomyces ophidiicola]
MREVNFSIPSVNKAAVSITTTLYDRRALDCTSTLPLINSLNHLAYLTTSSARIRDILTVDGGIERLVCILKEGRSRDQMEMWKWNLAFQCIVNIGVRGSENVRTRVVEADMVPVIATILDNYIRVVDKIRNSNEPESQRHSKAHKSRTREQPTRPTFERAATSISDHHRSTRRQAPPPSIEIPQPYSQQETRQTESGVVDATPSPQMVLTSPPERTTFPRETHSHRAMQPSSHRHRIVTPLATAVPSTGTADGFYLRPIRDIDRLPSQLPGLQNGLNSQPESPTTPHTAVEPQSISQYSGRARRRPSVRQQRSTFGDSDDGNGDDVVMADDPVEPDVSESIVGLQSTMDIENVGDQDAIMDDGAESHGIALPNPSEQVDAETFNITHRSVPDGSLMSPATQHANGAIAISPNRAAVAATVPPTVHPTPYPNYLRDHSVSPAVLTAMPRDEDVLMALQLLAYVSKYCSLRSYFQNTHLVPRLKIGKDIHMLDDPNCQLVSPIDPKEETEEYLLPYDFNIFPLVEKFTVRHHTKDMQYWACVVMRNLCRKDDARGGIRQCAYYKCGKWEEFQRQFAKCRRCRRTKYCSKECQKNAWVYHRHWCHSSP